MREMTMTLTVGSLHFCETTLTNLHIDKAISEMAEHRSSLELLHARLEEAEALCGFYRKRAVQLTLKIRRLHRRLHVQKKF